MPRPQRISRTTDEIVREAPVLLDEVDLPESPAPTTSVVTDEVLAAAEEAARDPSAAPEGFVRFVSVNPEPVPFQLGPYYGGRLTAGTKIACWMVPREDADNIQNHFFVTSGRIKRLDD